MEKTKESFGSVSLVIQGDHRFYSLTIPSDILASTCYVISREEDRLDGFQRRLDCKRAQEIATYIDSGLGTVPSSIILSAQENANLEYDGKKKSISFNIDPHSFLIIDGQHRVYGFTMAKKKLRIPVVIYDGLSRRDETRLFIDINSKQKGVPPELLLDIKKLAEYENTQEEYLRGIFDIFEKDRKSVLYGHLSSSTRRQGHLTRANLNIALKPILKTFGTRDCSESYEILNCYFSAFFRQCSHQTTWEIFNSTQRYLRLCVYSLIPLHSGQRIDLALSTTLKTFTQY